MKFLSNYEMRSHEQSHFRNERIFACPECNESFARFNDLRSHKKTHKAKQYSCPHCDKRFENFVAISEHTCPEKEHARINAHVMEVIEKFGTVEKPYSCSKCEKRFTWSNDLKNHERTHSASQTNRSEIQCSHCSEKSDDESEKPFRCSKCDKGQNIKVLSWNICRGTGKHM